MTTKEIAIATNAKEEYVNHIVQKHGYIEGDVHIKIESYANMLMQEIIQMHEEIVKSNRLSNEILECAKTSNELGMNAFKLYLLQKENIEKSYTFSEVKSKDKDSNGFVYIMHVSGTDYYKIGRTKNITCRESALKIGNHRIYCIASVIVNNAVKFENIMHRLYSEKNVGGEFFTFSISEIAELIKENGFSIAIE
jgi:hypothetical protein